MEKKQNPGSREILTPRIDRDKAIKVIVHVARRCRRNICNNISTSLKQRCLVVLCLHHLPFCTRSLSSLQKSLQNSSRGQRNPPFPNYFPLVMTRGTTISIKLIIFCEAQYYHICLYACTLTIMKTRMQPYL